MENAQLVLIRRGKKISTFNILAPRYLKKDGVTFPVLKVLQDAGCVIMDADALLRQMARDN